MPERFELEYVDAGGQRQRPVMLHRALYGSVERFLGILLEHHQGRLPAWLAPEQARVFALNADQLDSARSLCTALRAAGLRASLDASEDRLGSRIARARQLAIPFLLCVGAREARAGTVSLRQGDERSELGSEHAVSELAKACAGPFDGVG
jgi:threonyl-tRNA synthetase